MTSVARYFPTPLSLFVERVLFGFTIPYMVLVSIFSVNYRRQTYFRILNNGCYVLPFAGRRGYHFRIHRTEYGLGTDFRRKTSIFKFRWVWGVGLVVPGVVGRRVLCFRFLHAESAPVPIFVGNRASVTPPLAGY